MATPKATEKIKKHDVNFRLKYKSGLPECRYIDPGEDQVTFEHLDDAGYLRLRRKGYISPVDATKKDGK